MTERDYQILRWRGWLGATEIVSHEGRCTGHCCRSFNISISQETLDKMRAARSEGRSVSVDFKSQYQGDLDKVADMLIPLGNFVVTPGGDRFRWSDDGDSQWYTCKHHNRETGDCMNYENRPQLCREHPYGRRCNYVDCTRIEVGREIYEWEGPPADGGEPLLKLLQTAELDKAFEEK